MAKNSTKETQQAPVVPDFQDIDASEGQAAAQAVLSGGASKPLNVPKTADVRESKGTTYSRFAESIIIAQAYRSVTRSGLMDVTIGAKVRQSEDNNGAKVWFHFYLNTSGDVPEGHEQMNERSKGALVTLLQATGFMPTSGTLKASLLNKMFPQKNQPGTASPLVGKTVIANIVQQKGPRKDPKTKKQVVDPESGEVLIDRRDNAESFLPDDVESEE